LERYAAATTIQARLSHTGSNFHHPGVAAAITAAPTDKSPNPMEYFTGLKRMRGAIYSVVQLTTCASAAASNASEETIGPLPQRGKRAGDDLASQRKRQTFSACSKRQLARAFRSRRLSARSSTNRSERTTQIQPHEARAVQEGRTRDDFGNPCALPKRRPSLASALAERERRASQAEQSKPQLAPESTGPCRRRLRCRS
jgi:hypothetical protein